VWLSVIWVVGRFWGGCWNFVLVADCWCYEGSGVADCCVDLGLVAVWVAVWP
jgi:hypothetical protein